MLTKKEIDEAYRVQAVASEVAYVAGERAIEAKSDYERKFKAGLADGTISGKNDDLREACAYVILAKEIAELDTARSVERAAKLALDLAQTEVSRVQAVLRLMESTRGWKRRGVR